MDLNQRKAFGVLAVVWCLDDGQREINDRRREVQCRLYSTAACSLAPLLQFVAFGVPWPSILSFLVVCRSTRKSFPLVRRERYD